MAARPPENHHRRWGPAAAPATLTTSSTYVVHHAPPNSKLPIDFSPPLIAMVVVAAAAFLIVTYSRLISRRLFPPFRRLHRRWRRRRRHFPAPESPPPPPYDSSSSDGFFVYSPYGLDESVIKNIPLSIYKLQKSTKSSFSSKLGFTEDEFHDCAVCLLEFEDGDYIRTLPVCSHSFHVDCIDIWLRSHATCPLCRAGVLVPPPPESPLTPLMAARIRPSLDEGILLESIFLEPLIERSGEIQPFGDEDEEDIHTHTHTISPDRNFRSEDHRSNRRELDFLLKRSYSFGFERERSFFPSERIVMEPATTPYRRRRSFWTKRLTSSTTPFKSRVFSFRVAGIKSPAFFRRRGFFPTSESSSSLRFAGSSRMMKYMTSSVTSSRMRCGDPEALISPESFARG